MSTETTINQMKFNQLSETKYNQIVPEEGQFYITPDYINLPLLTSMWFDHIVNDISWLRSDTFAWQSGDVYTAVYNHLVNDISGKTAVSENVSGVTISYYLADDGHKITTDETSVANIYAATGVAWYYILDTTNHRFKLPRTKFGFTGLRNNVGNYVAPGLPNHTHYIANYNAQGAASGGGYITASSFAVGSVIVNSGTNGESGNGNWTDRSGTGYDTNKQQMTNASSSNSIYGASSTVQPPATQMYLYFYAGNFTNSAIEQTAFINAELLNQCRAALEEFNNIKTPNYYFYRWEGLSSISSVQEHRVSFTNKRGNPIYISISGDNNPTSDSAWLGISLYKDGVKLGYQIAESHGASWNIPFCLNYMDTNVIKGTTYRYTIKLYDGGNGTINLQESGTTQAPKISIFEL